MGDEHRGLNAEKMRWKREGCQDWEMTMSALFFNWKGWFDNIFPVQKAREVNTIGMWASIEMDCIACAF